MNSVAGPWAPWHSRLLVVPSQALYGVFVIGIVLMAAIGGGLGGFAGVWSAKILGNDFRPAWDMFLGMVAYPLGYVIWQLALRQPDQQVYGRFYREPESHAVVFQVILTSALVAVHQTIRFAARKLRQRGSSFE